MNRKYSWSFATIVLTVFILFFIFNSEYFAAKPTVDTTAAKVKASNVTLNGVLKDGGNISQYGFKWGISRSLNERVNLGRAIEADTSFSATLNGLKAGHTYYYQAYALNSKGYGLGDIKSFTVPELVNSAPTLSIVNPADRLSVTRGTTVKISANARDDKQVEAMSFYIDDVVKSKVNGAVLKYDWDTGSVKAGEHRLKVTAWDGYKTGEETRLVIVEDNKPVVTADNKQPNNSNNSSDNNTTVSRGQTDTDINKYPKLSKVNGIFGQFSYRELSGGRIEVDPNWVAENIVTITLPGLNRKVQVHKAAADNFIMAFNYMRVLHIN